MSGATGLFGIVLSRAKAGARLNALVDAVEVSAPRVFMGRLRKPAGAGVSGAAGRRTHAPKPKDGLFRISAGLEDVMI